MTIGGAGLNIAGNESKVYKVHKVRKVYKAPKNQKSAIFVIFRESTQNYEIEDFLFCGIESL